MMDSSKTKLIPFIAVAFVVVMTVWVVASAMEAHAFNAATGKNVPIWTAMWIELRVIEPAK